MKDKSLELWNKSVHISVILGNVLLVTFAIGGYVSFYDYTQGNKQGHKNASYLQIA